MATRTTSGNGRPDVAAHGVTALRSPPEPPGVVQREDRPARADPVGAKADYRLTARCLAGEVAAWEGLYAQCHDALCISIKVMLGRKSDANLVDEIAARVWYRLVDKDGELLSRYSPARGARLITFMRALAKDEMCRHFRSAARRRSRESVAVQSRGRQEENEPQSLGSDLKLFLSTLTPQEHVFCREVLLGEPTTGPSDSARSKTNVWQLTHRVYEKLRRFLRR
ncbi:MAG: hypothetical protein LLG00_11745 [Planctomycetaceae bacterium]|nr:hypothetical protein [Planctomycetaceae bacterium]